MPNLHSASKLRQLDSLGSSKGDFDIEEQNNVVASICGEFIKRVQNNIQAQGLNATGRMGELQITEEPDGISISAPVHLVFQDMGVNGNKARLYDTPFAYTNKMPPVESIKEWIRLKGIQTKNNEHFHGEKTDIDEGAAWAIAKNIQQYGQAPKDIYSREIPELVADLSEALADFAIREVFNGFD